MESSGWLRIGSIVAMVVGSVWVLLPTILQESAEDRFARTAATVEAPVSARPADLDVEFDVVDGDGEALARVLEARLAAIGHPVDRVLAVDGGVRVHLSPGGRAEVVARLATAPGRRVLAKWPAPAADPAPEAVASLAPALEALVSDPGQAAALAASVGGSGGSVEALGVDVVGVSVDAAGPRLVLSGAWPAGVPGGLVVVDDAVAGAALPDGDGARWVPLTDAVGLDAERVAVAVSGPLVGRLVEAAVTPQVVAAAPTAPADPAATSSVPDWFIALLPETRMNLGLDLQGGLDLTLQVGVADAVVGQIERDRVYAEDYLRKQGLTVQKVRRDRTEHLLWVETASDLGPLQEVMRRAAPNYPYVFSEGAAHAFRLRDDVAEVVERQAVEQVLETLRRRIDATGVKEPSIVKKGGGRINVQLPGEGDLQRAIDAIGTSAVLEFRMVDAEFDPSLLDRLMIAAADALPKDQLEDPAVLNDWLWSTKRLAEDRLVLYEQERAGNEPRPLVLHETVVLTGADVSDARVAYDQNNQPSVTLNFKARGASVFCDITTRHVGKRFAIILDDVVRSSPSIRERICGGAASIEMAGADDPLRDAQNLAIVLRTGSLDAPVLLADVRTVGAQLGADSIRSSTLASVLGSVLVFAYMALWYRVSGMVANVALCVNVLLVLAALCLFGATLTLPGIAALALTVGMAVDANIIIYERIREELRAGVLPRKAVDVGFDRAAVAILDSNITSAIAGVVLYSYGTGPIKGFAVTLIIGIITTLITALFVSRALMVVLTRNSESRLSI